VDMHWKISITYFERWMWIQVQDPLVDMNLLGLKFKWTMDTYKGYAYSKKLYDHTFFYSPKTTFLNL
jgi:hypothetical protein